MLARRVRAQVVAFIVVALVTIAFIGFNYVGLDRLFGDPGYTVTLELSEGGGIYEQAEVTYRGVGVGEVTAMRLTDDGMEAELFINDSAPAIPEDTKAVVANRSAIGEQYVDLQPRSPGQPFLDEDSMIAMSDTERPLPVSTLLENVSTLSESVPKDALRSVVDEMYKASRAVGPELQQLLDSATSFTNAASEALPETTTLIHDGSTVLATQLDSAKEWRSFADNAKLFAKELASADGDLRELIAKAPPAATELAKLLKDTNPEMSVLLANLLTTAELFTTRTAGMHQTFSILPKAIGGVSAALSDESMLSVSLAFYDPPPCYAGYQETENRKAGTTSPLPFNTKAHCALPAGSETSVRGSQNAPSGGVPEPAVPGSADATNPPAASGLDEVSTTLEELLWLTN